MRSTFQATISKHYDLNHRIKASGLAVNKRGILLLT